MCSEMRRQDQDAVSPVVGTLLVLAITVVGMAGIMLWGAPTIEAVQAQNAQVALIGEFEELRASSIELSIPDASRIPTINVPRGELAIEQGTRMMVTAEHDATCDFHVKDWADNVPETSITYTSTLCSGSHLEVLEVVGSNTVRRAEVAVGATPNLAGHDLSEGDWLFRLTNGDDLAPLV